MPTTGFPNRREMVGWYCTVYPRFRDDLVRYARGGTTQGENPSRPVEKDWYCVYSWAKEAEGHEVEHLTQVKATWEEV